jgi:hypothetical protein
MLCALPNENNLNDLNGLKFVKKLKKSIVIKNTLIEVKYNIIRSIS